MNLIDDPSMKEIIIDFCNESDELINELESILESVENEPENYKELEKFGQIVDRIMGAAKSIGASDVASLSELGKTIGYKASQVNDIPLIEIVVAVLFDSLDLMKEKLSDMRDGKKNDSKLNTKTFVTRLNWLSEKFKNIDRSSCAITDDDEEQLSQTSIDDLLKILGL